MASIVQELGHAGADAGWRKKVADGIAVPLADRTPVRADLVRAGLGLFFVGLSVYYLVGTARRLRRRRS
jgi:uncharacterized protein YjeT (DUF2065 family)